MTADELISLLRSASEDDVIKALNDASFAPPLSDPTELLEFYNRVVDVLLDTRAETEAAERLRIPPGFGSTD